MDLRAVLKLAKVRSNDMLEVEDIADQRVARLCAFENNGTVDKIFNRRFETS